MDRDVKSYSEWECVVIDAMWDSFGEQVFWW